MSSIHSLFRRPFVAGFILIGLAACQTDGTSTPSASVTPAAAMTSQAPVADINGAWSGTFTNRRGNGFPVSFVLDVKDGKITGTGDIPSSSIETKPSVTGMVSGDHVTMQLSSGFHYDLTMNATGTRMNGDVSGPNTGTISLSR